jgi:hypothetical protein
MMRISSSVEASRDNPTAQRGGDDDGVPQGLSLVRPGTYKSVWEANPLVLKTDAFLVSFYGKAATIQYYSDGRWPSYVTSD